MSDILGTLLKKMFGSASERYVKNSRAFVNRINELEPVYAQLSDDELRTKSDEFKKRIEEKKKQIFSPRSLGDLLTELQEVPEERRKSLKKQIVSGLNECSMDVLPEAFAAIREAGKRKLAKKHF